MTEQVGPTRPAGVPEHSREPDRDDHGDSPSHAIVALYTSDVPLAELFPTIASRRYLTVPVRFLPPRLHVQFGRRPWRWFMALSPRALHEYDRVDEVALGSVLSALRDEDDLAAGLTR